jgi:hypothetical protein
MGKRGAASLELCADGVRCGVQMFNLLFEHMQQKPAPPPVPLAVCKKLLNVALQSE